MATRVVTALHLLGPRIPIGMVEFDGPNGRRESLRVYPTRELQQYLTDLLVRVGGSDGTVDLVQPPPDIMGFTGSGSGPTNSYGAESLLLVSATQLQEVVREIMASERVFAPAGSTGSSDGPAVMAPVRLAAEMPEMIMGYSDDA